jgi:DNA (cytosine-5)-methyltransferase 1
MSLGFEQAGFDIVYAVDRDAFNVATHRRNFPSGVAECLSVTTLTGERIRRVGKIKGEVDVVFGGPPCQGFSSIGLRDSKDPRNNLLGEFVRIVEELRPRTFVMENVPGLATRSTKSLLDRVLARLQLAGYKLVTPVRILNAANFGVPQNRKRLFVLGVRSDISATLHYPDGLLDGQAPRPTILEALGDLPPLERLNVDESHQVPYALKPLSPYAEMSRGHAIDFSDRSRPRVWNSAICTCVTKVVHSAKTRALYAGTSPGALVVGHKLPRLDPNGIAPTLRAGSDSERGSHTAPRPIHYLEPRCVTAREAARLHGYPDWFQFYPGKYHAYRQIGNSVCPPVARAVGYEIIKILGVRLSRKPPAPIQLRDGFELPTGRQRSSRRLVQVVEYPKVVEAIFRSRFDTQRRKWGSSSRTITVRNVRDAVRLSGASMAAVPPERFVKDILRNRNRERILALPLHYGFTLREGSGHALGEFVALRSLRVEGSVHHRV